jgi:hypothetical protein
MILSHYRRLDGDLTPNGSLAPLFKFVVDQHVDGDVLVVRRRYEVDGLGITVTVGPKNRVEVREGDRVERGDQSLFRPTFTMVNGFDHRCSSWLFSHFGVHAELIEPLDAQALAALFRNGKIDFFLASVASFHYDCSHVVVVEGFKDDYFTVVNPSDTTYRAAIRYFPLPLFASLFNGFGTAVYGP